MTATNVAGVYRTDLDKLDFFGHNRYPTCLYYNPGKHAAHVDVSLDKPRLLYDAVSDKVLARSAHRRATITVPAGNSVVLVEATANGHLTHAKNRTRINGTAVGYNTMVDRNVARAATAKATGTLPGSSADTAIDSSEHSAWRVRNGSALDIDLESGRRVSSISVRWGVPRPRHATISTSADGTSWTKAWSGRVTGGEQDLHLRR